MQRPLSQSLSQLDRSALNFVGDEEKDINLHNYQMEAIKIACSLKTHELALFYRITWRE